MSTSTWLINQPNSLKRLRLFCFSYAGGSATTYRLWQEKLAQDIQVCAIQLPGRGPRLIETPYTSLPVLIEKLAEVIGRQDNLPFAFFGHSLGGLVAFELTRYFREHGLPMPCHLFASGCSAPQYQRRSSRYHELDDGALIEVLRDYNGTPAALLEHRELMTLLLPTVRADFALVENYRYLPAPALDIPITVLAGTLDKYDTPEGVSGWQQETSNTCDIRWFDGDHFFVDSAQDAVLDFLNHQLAERGRNAVSTAQAAPLLACADD
jgi:surfactin synthase thioesterase subunit